MVKDAVISVRVDPDVREVLEKAAAKDERTLSWLASKILTEWARKQSKK